ncbi:MAG: hypothetical protein ACRESJ_30585 [Pseudomonas sp.]|uniref:hypothetical protein n=1 Tax=Pseudomonas sp. TaxID=306 RepID=UPI003D700233
MNGAFGHSSSPPIAESEIFRNIEKDGTAFILIALAVSPFIYRRIIGGDSFVPPLLKKVSATTQKND